MAMWMLAHTYEIIVPIQGRFYSRCYLSTHLHTCTCIYSPPTHPPTHPHGIVCNTHSCCLLEVPQEISQFYGGNVRRRQGSIWDKIATPGSSKQVVFPDGRVVECGCQVLGRRGHGPVRTLLPLHYLLQTGDSGSRLGSWSLASLAHSPGRCVLFLFLFQLLEKQLAVRAGGLRAILA